MIARNEKKVGTHSAKMWQIALFSLNNVATNIPMLLMGGFFLMYCTDAIGLGIALVGLIATGSRLFDGVTDPIIGFLIDKTNTKFGKFRPFMLLGNIILCISVFALYSNSPDASNGFQYAWLIIWYVVYIIGYTFQTACTKAAQVVLTNDPKQRPLFGGFDGVYNTILFGFGAALIVPSVIKYGGLNNALAWRKTMPLFMAVSFVLTILAIIGISGKDNEKYFGQGEKKNQKTKFKDYWPILKENRALQMLLVAAATDKLAYMTVSAATMYFYLYVVGNPIMQSKMALIGMPAGLVFTFIGVFLARKYGQKKTFVIGTWVRLIGLALLILVRPFGDLNGTLLFYGLMILAINTSGISNNVVIPMIADISEYEAHRSGRFVPGMIGTAFSFVDKLISSLGTTIVGFVLGAAGYVAGMESTPTLYWSIIFCFVGIPILGHVASLIAMKFYPLDQEYMENMKNEDHNDSNFGNVQNTAIEAM